MNLTSFVGTVDDLAFAASDDVSSSSSSPHDTSLFVRICKKRVQKKKGVDQNDDMMETTTAVKLGMGVEGGFQSDQDKYETVSTYSIIVGNNADGDGKLHVLAELPYDDESKNFFPMIVSKSADAIISHAGLAVRQDLTAWELEEEPKLVSKYLESLPFVDNGVQISENSSDWKVSLRKQSPLSTI